MTNRFKRLLSWICALTMLIGAVSAFAGGVEETATSPADQIVLEEGAGTEAPTEEPATTADEPAADSGETADGEEPVGETGEEAE